MKLKQTTKYWHVDFLISNNKSPPPTPNFLFYFFVLEKIQSYSLYFRLNYVSRIFLKKLLVTIFTIIHHKSSNLCQTLSKNVNFCTFIQNEKNKRWRYDLWERIEHITANFGQYPVDLLLEKDTPVILKIVQNHEINSFQINDPFSPPENRKTLVFWSFQGV